MGGVSGLTPGERRFKEEWSELSKGEQWEQHLNLYRRYHNNLMQQIQNSVTQLPRLEIENNK